MGIFTNKEIKAVAPEAYLPFAAYVIQTRALPDSRDCLKSGGRYILWSQYLNKNTSNKPRIKANDAVGAIMKFNPHGDAGIYGNLVRFAKPFAMRYMLEDAKGNTGTMTKGDDHTAPRYLEIRASKIADEFYTLIDKGGVENMKLNYTQTLEYPEAFPTLFPNFVNGNTGIGVGCTSSICQYNLTEAIDSIKKLVYDRSVDFDEIYIAPDFATGGIITNASEVKESLRVGHGKAVKLRAKIDYDVKEHCLIVTQIPFQVFTDRIMSELATLEENGKLVGIKNYFDGTDKSCGRYGTKIRIYLTPTANPGSVCKFLYKHTSLQSHFSINCLMLENGIKPKLYGQREMMLAYLDNMENSVRRSYLFELNKLNNKINILNGYLIAIAHIEEIVEIIKKSKDSSTAIQNLIDNFEFNDAQAKAILELKLQRLVGLEGIKIKNDLNNAQARVDELNAILNTTELFNKEIIKILDRIQKTYGDERRTEVKNLESLDEEEPLEKKQLIVHLTNFNNIYVYEDSSLISQRRGGIGSKVKMSDGETIISTISDSNYNNVLMFSDQGKVYNCNLNEVTFGTKIPLSTLLELDDGEKITAMISDAEKNSSKFIIFVTKNGLIKKSKISEYNIRKSKGVIAIKLKDSDKIIDVFLSDEKTSIGIATKQGSFVSFGLNEVNTTGRATSGVKAITLRADDEVVKSTLIKSDSTEILTITKSGMVKRTALNEIPLGSRANKGSTVHKLQEDDVLVSVAAIGPKNENVIVSSKTSCIKFNLAEVRASGRNTVGTKAIKLAKGNEVKGVFIE